MESFTKYASTIKSGLIPLLGNSTTSSNAVNELGSLLASNLAMLDAQIKDIHSQKFLSTATSETAIINKAWEISGGRLYQKDGNYATGYVICTTENTGVSIEKGTQFSTEDNAIYESRIAMTTSEYQLTLTEIQRSNNITTVKSVNHGLSSGMELEIYDSSSSNITFVGIYEITVIDNEYFTYDNSGDDEIYSGSTIYAKFNGAKVPVISALQGDTMNKSYYDAIELISYNLSINGTFIEYNGITGGTSIEDILVFSDRSMKYVNENQFIQCSRQARIFWIEQNTNSNFTYSYRTLSDKARIYFVMSQFDTTNLTFTNFTEDELDATKELFISNSEQAFLEESIDLNFINPTFIPIDITITGLIPLNEYVKEQVKLNLKTYINPLPINEYLSELSELSDDTIRQVILDTYDQQGNKAKITSITISGVSNLINKYDKPIVGNVIIS